MNRASVKGLEFDTVIVPDADVDTGDPTAAGLRMMYYVISTRARIQLYFCYSGDVEPPILSSIPHKTLRREYLPNR